MQWHAPVIQLFETEFWNDVGSVPADMNSPSKWWVDYETTCNPAQVQESEMIKGLQKEKRSIKIISYQWQHRLLVITNLSDGPWRSSFWMDPSYFKSMKNNYKGKISNKQPSQM